MNKFLKQAKELIAKGFATASEKDELLTMFKALDENEQEVSQPKVDEVNDLPETEKSEEEISGEIEKGLQKLLKNATDEMKDEMRGYLKSQFEALDKKSGIYHPAVQEERKAKNDAFRKFLFAIQSDDAGEISKVRGVSVKEMTTDDTGSPYGGYTVESELAMEIHHLIGEYGVARREFNTIQLSKNSYKSIDLVTDVTVYWVDEGAAIKSTQVVLGQDTLELKKLGAIVTLTSELLQDSEIDLFSFIGDRVAEKFAAAEDAAFFVGDGTSTYGGFTGLIGISGTNTVTLAVASTFSSVGADDFLDMQDATPAAANSRAKYYMNRSIRSLVRKLKDENGQYIYSAPNGTDPAMLWDKPIVEVEVLPTKAQTAASKVFALYGDLKRACIFGYKGAIAAKRFDAGVVRNVADNADINLITTDREAMRWTERVGYICVLPQAVTRIRTGAAS